MFDTTLKIVTNINHIVVSHVAFHCNSEYKLGIFCLPNSQNIGQEKYCVPSNNSLGTDFQLSNPKLYEAWT